MNLPSKIILILIVEKKLLIQIGSHFKIRLFTEVLAAPNEYNTKIGAHVPAILKDVYLKFGTAILYYL